jgi:hypothetical protein
MRAIDLGGVQYRQHVGHAVLDPVAGRLSWLVAAAVASGIDGEHPASSRQSTGEADVPPRFERVAERVQQHERLAGSGHGVAQEQPVGASGGDFLEGGPRFLMRPLCR